MTTHVQFQNDAFVAARHVAERAQSILGVKLPLEVRATPAFEAAELLAGLAGGELELELARADVSKVQSAIASLEPFAGEHPAIARLVLAARCRCALEAGEPVTVAELVALAGRSRGTLFEYFKRRRMGRVGRGPRGTRIAAADGRRVVAAFRREGTFRAWATPAQEGRIGMLDRIRKVPEEGGSPRARLASRISTRGGHCSPPRRRLAPKGGAS